MPSTKPGANATINDYGDRVLRTIQRADQTHLLEYQQLDTDGRMHPDEPPLRVESTALVAWITNAWNNPGTSAKLDALKAANPTLTLAHIAPARQLAFIALDALNGFTEE